MKSLLFLTIDEAIAEVTAILPECDDLRRAGYRGRLNPAAGHCYVASEVIFHLTGWKYKPMFIRHEGEPHWYLLSPDGDVVDVTHWQFRTPVPYDQGRGKGFLTPNPSKRAKEMMRRIAER